MKTKRKTKNKRQKKKRKTKKNGKQKQNEKKNGIRFRSASVFFSDNFTANKNSNLSESHKSV